MNLNFTLEENRLRQSLREFLVEVLPEEWARLGTDTMDLRFLLELSMSSPLGAGLHITGRGNLVAVTGRCGSKRSFNKSCLHSTNRAAVSIWVSTG